MSTRETPLSERQLLIVRLIAAGFVRWRIAELSGLGEDTVRTEIRTMCERFDCRMEHLPDAVLDEYPDTVL